MPDKALKVLLIEDNPGDARLLREVLSEVRDYHFELFHADSLRKGLARLEEAGADVILLDLSLPESQGLDTVVQVHARAPEVPIVVLSGQRDTQLSLRAVQAGAQDYLVKGRTDGELLVRAMHYAIERHRMRAALISLSIMDDLTGLYNRRGFLVLAQKQLQLSERGQRNLFFLFTDLDGLKGINDAHGHLEGDQALRDVADVLRQTFRESDIVARIGGDEFVVLAAEVRDTTGEVLTQRLREQLAAANARRLKPYQLGLSIGLTRYNPEKPSGIEELLSRADELMYAQKRFRHTDIFRKPNLPESGPPAPPPAAPPGPPVA